MWQDGDAVRAQRDVSDCGPRRLHSHHRIQGSNLSTLFINSSSLSATIHEMTHQGCSIFAVGSINGSDIVAFVIKKRVIVVQVVGDSYTPLREFAAPSTPTLVTVVLGSVAIAHDRTFTVFDWESLRPQVRPLVCLGCLLMRPIFPLPF
jgi:hypothetical protein